MTLVEKLSDVRDFRKILETTVKEIGENYSADVCQIVLSNPLDGNFTSICEYISNPDEIPDDLASTTFPVQPEGGGLGWLSVSRQNILSREEIDEIRIILANIADILRYAQINDIVQRDTFRSAFMSEITNLMSLPMGLGDALFMVVNILGKALAVSRCIFVCVDDSSWLNLSEWRSYEYWQRERIESAQDYGWPTKDSAVVAQTLLSSVPIMAFEGQHNSYKTPVQEEMEFIGVRSQLSVALRSSIGVHGCIILQQCESRHAWTRDEVDMVQNVADTVAEALAQLDDEKKTAEPIMRLHQHEVADTKAPGQQSMQEVRKALKGALGTTTIKKAQKSRAPQPAATPPPAQTERGTQETALNFAPQAEELLAASHPEPYATPFEAAAAAEPTFGQAQFSPSDIWTEQEGALAAPPEPDYEQAFASTELEAGSEAAPTYEPAPAGYEPAATESQPSGYEPASTSYGAEPSGYEPASTSYGAEPAGYEAAPASYEPAPTSYESAPPSYEPAPASSEIAPANSQLSGLANILEQQATQTDPGHGAFKGVLGGLLSNRGSAGSPAAWDIETSLEQPPAPAAAVAPTPPVAPRPPAPPTPPPGWTPPPAQAAAPPVGAPAPAVSADTFPTTPQGPSLRPGQGLATPGHLAGEKAPDKWGELDSVQSHDTPAAQHPVPAPHGRQASKWGDLDSIPSPGAPGARPSGPIPAAGPQDSGSEWASLNSIPTPANTGKTGLGAMMMGKAKASAITGNSGLGQSLHKGGVKPPAPPSFVDGPPIQMDEAAEAAAEAKLRQILASSNPTSDFIFATPNIDMRLLGRIDGWVSQIEPKDKYEHGHVRAVAEYATSVSRLLGLSPEDVNMIRLAAIIHDVGKLGLPKLILQKPDEALSDAELVMTMNHTIDGAKLIEEFPELAELAPIVLAHHEEYDGNGYPEGLSGEDIPLAARIIHACNAYTELVSDLVYRAGIEPEQAQNTMIRGAGSTYDPDVVKALIACISQGIVPPRIV